MSSPLTLVVPIAGLIATLVSIGVLWGALRTQVSHLRDEVSRLIDTVDRQEALLHGLSEEVRVRFASQEASKRRAKRRAP